MTPAQPAYTRREFLVCLGAVASAAALAPARAASAPAPVPSAPAVPVATASPDAWVNIGPADSFPVGTPTPVAKARLVASKLEMSKPELTVFRTAGGIRVISTRCTHNGCSVGLEKKGGFLCPCHESRFDAEGKPVRGPAKDPLPWYDIKFTDRGDVLVNKATPVTHGQPYPVPAPGAAPDPVSAVDTM